MPQLWATGLWAPGLWAPGLWEGFGSGTGLGDGVVILTQPSGAVSGLTLSVQPVVKVVDEFGLTLTSYAGRIKAILVSGNAQLIGDTVYAVAGVGTYTTLRMDGTGSQIIAFITLDLPAPVGIDADPINMAPSAGGQGRFSLAGRRIRGRGGHR